MAMHAHIPFHFHADGHAVSGRFDRPVPHVIEAQASASLPWIGGIAQARVENFRALHLLSFKAAHTHVSGSKQDENVTTTNATSVVEGLDILGVITADRIVSRLTYEYDPRDKENKEGHILALGSDFVNLRIAGHLVEVILRQNLLLEHKTFKSLRDKLEADKGSGHEVDVYGEVVLCSLVEEIRPKDLPGVERIGRHILKVKHFGTISFAEVLATAGARTLTMLNIHLGSPDGALLTVTQTFSNGRPWPPPP
jgi:hypothetical protein